MDGQVLVKTICLYPCTVTLGNKADVKCLTPSGSLSIFLIWYSHIFVGIPGVI